MAEESTGPQRSRIFPRAPGETLVGTPAQAQLLAWDSSHLTLSYSSLYMCVKTEAEDSSKQLQKNYLD